MINFSRLLVAVCFFVVAAGPVHGQVVLDGTMGAAGELSGPEYDIKADYGRTAGANLFHGFSTFNVNTAEKATFSGPAHVQNIISRVSGGEASSIDGTIQSTIPGANLYLLNPAGVMFGENASLDLTGSFHVSSGDYLLMGENDRFYTTPRPGEVLSASAPTAFGFLGDSAGPITLHGKGKIEGGEAGPPGLVVQEGQTISLIGGDIEIKGTFTEEIYDDGAVSITPFGKSLVADAGRVHIASVASAGEVTPTGAGLDVTASASGEISISDGAIIDVSGEGSGSVFIRGGKFFLGNGSQMLADARGAQDGGVTDILADEVTLQNSEIFSDATGSGKGGDITINGVESISITESRVFSDATGENSNAGNVTISTKRLTIVDGQVSSETYGKGAGGEILLRASESIDITGDGSQIIGRASGETEDAGNAGTITIHTKSLSLTDRAKITGDTSYGGAAGGAIVIRGFEGEGHFADAVTISGDAKILSGAIDGEFAGKGEGGRIEISANRISLTDGARIDAISDGMGDAGEINLHTNSLALDNGSFVTSESASTSVHAGDAGKITVNAADSVELMGSSALTTEANGAGGGQIHVNAGNKIHLFNGEITSSVQRGEGKGGDVSTASEFVILNNGDIIANAEEGDGGAIFIVTENYLKSVDSTVSATSKRGNDGTVKIEAPDLDITSGLVALPTSLLDVTQWVETPCAARSGESVSRFVLRGWDASPARPDDLRPFRLFWFEEPGQGDDPGEREDPGRKSPPGSWPLDHEENEKAPSDCPDGDC